MSAFLLKKVANYFRRWLSIRFFSCCQILYVTMCYINVWTSNKPLIWYQVTNIKKIKNSLDPPGTIAMYIADQSPIISPSSEDKKEEIWPSPMTKAPIPTEMSKGQSDNTNNATKKFDWTAIADRLRTVSWSNYSHPTGVVNRFTGPPSHSPQQPCNQKDTFSKTFGNIVSNGINTINGEDKIE